MANEAIWGEMPHLIKVDARRERCIYRERKREN
jgi:hypothetical protein